MKIINGPKKRGVGKTVLVVDDNAGIRKLLAVAFLSDGFTTCVQAENGKEGIKAAKKIKPDVITLDFSMPVMNGLRHGRASDNVGVILVFLDDDEDVAKMRTLSGRRRGLRYLSSYAAGRSGNTADEREQSKPGRGQNA